MIFGVVGGAFAVDGATHRLRLRSAVIGTTHLLKLPKSAVDGIEDSVVESGRVTRLSRG